MTEAQMQRALRYVADGGWPERDRVMLLLSHKTGLRAGEIAALTWSMVTDARGRIADRLDLHDAAAKMGSGRTVPFNPELRRALKALWAASWGEEPVTCSWRGSALRASSVVNWFAGLCRELGFAGFSSHSGRQSFVTNAARLVSRAGGSLRDVQQLVGHRSIEQPSAISRATARPSAASSPCRRGRQPPPREIGRDLTRR